MGANSLLQPKFSWNIIYVWLVTVRNRFNTNMLIIFSTGNHYTGLAGGSPSKAHMLLCTRTLSWAPSHHMGAPVRGWGGSFTNIGEVLWYPVYPLLSLSQPLFTGKDKWPLGPVASWRDCAIARTLAERETVQTFHWLLKYYNLQLWISLFK